MKKVLVFDVPQILRLFDVVERYVVTNLTAVDNAWFAAKALDVTLENMRVHTLPGEPARVGPASVWTLYRAEAIEIINRYYNPHTDEIPAGSFNIHEGLRIYAHLVDIDGSTMAELAGN